MRIGVLTGHRVITEITLKTALITIQSINQLKKEIHILGLLPCSKIQVYHFRDSTEFNMDVKIRVFCEIVCVKYRITCIQRPLKGSNESGLLQQLGL